MDCAGVIGTAAYTAPELLNPQTPDAAGGRQLGPRDEERMLKADVSEHGLLFRPFVCVVAPWGESTALAGLSVNFLLAFPPNIHAGGQLPDRPMQLHSLFLP